MPTGKVKFFDENKGFGYITSDEGGDVYLAASALPAGVNTVRSGTRLEFSVVAGRRGAQALSVRLLNEPPSLVKMTRRPAEDMAIVVEDLIKLLDGVGAGLKRGRYPENSHSQKIAAMLRKVADDFDV
ncbi:MAG TPA: cold-shock protein [Pseudoclavibacter sp.]|nr:cold-shock protein [Pseudoclavibacter sp.]